MRYNQAFQNCLQRPLTAPAGKQNYQSYVVLAKNRKTRDHLAKTLQEQKIETTVGTYALSLLSAFSATKRRHSLARSRQAFHRSLTLPLYNGMTEEEVNQVIQTVLA